MSASLIVSYLNLQLFATDYLALSLEMRNFAG